MTDQIIPEELKNELIPIANDIKNNTNISTNFFCDKFIVSGEIIIDWYSNCIDISRINVEFADYISDDMKSEFSWMLKSFVEHSIGKLQNILYKNHKDKCKLFNKLLKKLNKLSSQYNVPLYEICGTLYDINHNKP